MSSSTPSKPQLFPMPVVYFYIVLTNLVLLRVIEAPFSVGASAYLP
jgi:hypothetical protein